MEARETDSSGAIRGELAAVVTTNAQELAEALLAHVRNLDLDIELNDEDITWLQVAATEALSVLATAFEEGDRWTGPLPPAVLSQIRYAARRGTSLESFLRIFSVVGTVVLGFVAERFDELEIGQDVLRYAMRWHGWNYEPIMNAFASEYAAEVERLEGLPSRRLAESVEGLLAGGSGEHTDLGYRLDAVHIGVIAAGERAELECRRMAESLGCDLLLLPRAEDAEEIEEVVWAWFGSRRRIEFERLERQVDGKRFLFLAAGEPRDGIDGWRLTHREAQAALAVALLEPARLTRYSDVALVAHAVRDEAMAKSLLDRYLKPLNRHRDAEQLRRTVGVYLDLDCNAASTASALGVNRHTVQRRLRRVEEAVGEPLSARRAELDVALRVERLTMQRYGDAPTSGSVH